MDRTRHWLPFYFVYSVLAAAIVPVSIAAELRVGAAAMNIPADDSMVIGGNMARRGRRDKKASCAPRRW